MPPVEFNIHLLSPLPFPPSARSWCALLVVSETTLTRINLHPSGSFQGACTRSFGHMPGHVTSEYLTYTMTRFLYILCALFFPVSGGCVLQTGTKERRASRSHTWPFSAYDAHWSDAKRGLKIRKKKKWIKLAVLMSAKGTLQLWKPPPPPGWGSGSVSLIDGCTVTTSLEGKASEGLLFSIRIVTCPLCRLSLFHKKHLEHESVHTAAQRPLFYLNSPQKIQSNYVRVSCSQPQLVMLVFFSP